MKAAKEELKKKCEIYSRGCLKYKKKEEGAFFLFLPERIESTINTDDFHTLLQSPFFQHYTLKERENGK